MKRFRFLALLVLLILACLIVVPVCLAHRQKEQEKANAALNAATKNNDTAGVIAALNRGADANARDLPPDTRSFWKRIWEGLQGKHRESEQAPTTLLVALMSREGYQEG